MQALLTRVSMNKKTGPIPVSISSSETCPTSCPLNGPSGACYASLGPLGLIWRRVDRKGGRSVNFDQFLDQVKALPKGQLWRHNAAGDLPGAGDAIDHAQLDRLVKASKGKRAWTYSHKPVGLSGQKLINAQAIYAANKSGFTVNLSANNIVQADELAELGIAPVVVIVPSDAKNMRTPKGRYVTVCPAETAGITCDRCRLCAIPGRKAIIGFRAHGARKKAVNEMVSKYHLKMVGDDSS